jgi:hypothetical protein
VRNGSTASLHVSLNFVRDFEKSAPSRFRYDAEADATACRQQMSEVAAVATPLSFSAPTPQTCGFLVTHECRRPIKHHIIRSQAIQFSRSHRRDKEFVILDRDHRTIARPG